MTTEIKFSPSAGAAVATQGTATEDKPLVQQEKQVAPLLGGENVKVTSGATTDLEKLVAQLKNETNETKMSVTQRRISILSTVLDSMADRISAKERESIIEIEKLDGEKATAEGELAGYTSGKAATEGRIAALDVQIAALENAIKQAVQDGEDHREQVAKLKEQRAQEQQKLDQINEAIASVNAKIAGIDVKIAECTKAIAQTTLNEVANALRTAARDTRSVSSTTEGTDERNADRVEKAKKEAETDIGNVIREALDKIESEIRAVLDEAQMKVEG